MPTIRPLGAAMVTNSALRSVWFMGSSREGSSGGSAGIQKTVTGTFAANRSAV